MKFNMQGVVQQTIKDINQSLVDDFLVFSDKIGAANFFWSFPSKAYQDQLSLRDKTLHSVKCLHESENAITMQISSARNTRQLANRAIMLSKLCELQEEERNVDTTLQSMKMNDPEEIGRIAKQSKVNNDGANRWTDNIWIIKSFLTKKRGMAGKEVVFFNIIL